MEYLILALILVAAAGYAGRCLYRSMKGRGCGCEDCPACSCRERPEDPACTSGAEAGERSTDDCGCGKH